METIVKTTGLTKKYHSVCALDHVTLSINRGDIFGFVGANGAGKTTFMRMVCGLIKPTQGTLELFGAVSKKELQEKRKKMGALIEHPAVYANMSALQNLDVQRRYLDRDLGRQPKQKLMELLDLVGLAEVKDRKAGKFSLGMRQRLGLARAFLHDAPFLLLDEPPSNLDSLNEAVILKSLREGQDGKTVLLVSHRQSTMRVADAVYSVEDLSRTGGRVS